MTEYPAIMRSRYRAANIPVRLQGLMEDHTLVSEALAGCTPQNVVDRYLAAFRDGRILRATGQYRTCGKGLWMHRGEAADVLGAALLQTLLLQETVESGLFLSVHDLLDSETPEGEVLGDRAFCDLLVLQGLGEEHRSATGWSGSVIFGLLRRRYDRGLPTIVSGNYAPDKSGIPESFIKSAFIEVMVRSSHA